MSVPGSRRRMLGEGGGGSEPRDPSGSTRCRADGSCLSGAALWVTQSARWGRVTVRM